MKKLITEWRNYINEMNLGTPTKDTNYTAYVLDEESQQKLAGHAPAQWKIHSHHMTIISPTEQKMGRIPARWFDFKDCIAVVAIAKNDYVMTAKVDMSDMPMPFKLAGLPHITIATNPMTDGKPEMSNEFREGDFEPIAAFNVCGQVQEVNK